MKMTFGIRVKSIIAITILVIGVASILSLFFIKHETRIIHSDLKEMGLVLASNLAYNAEFGVLTSSQSNLANLIEGVVKQKQVAYCIIQDIKGNALASKGLNKDLLDAIQKFNDCALTCTEPQATYVVTKEGKEYYEISVPVMTRTVKTPTDELSIFQNEEEWATDSQQEMINEESDAGKRSKTLESKIGVARIGLSLQSASDLERKGRQVAAVITFMIVIVAWLITTLITGVAVGPIKKLVEGTEHIAKGELDFKITDIPSDEIGQLAESFNNMTEDLRRSRDELIKAKEYTDNIIRSMVDVLFVIDPNGIIRTVNSAATKILGYKENEIVGKSIDFIFVEEGNFKGSQSWIIKRLTREGVLTDLEMNYKTKDGNTIPVIFSGSVMRNKDGIIEGVVGIAKDITERKRAQLLIEQKNKKLEEVNQSLIENEKKLKSMLLDLKKAHDDLQDTQFQLFQSEKLKVVGRLASGVAHEVKNPLAIILQGVEYLAKKVPKDNQNVAEVINDITNAVHRADTVIKGVLDYSSLSDLKMELLDINSVIDITLLLVKHEFTQNHVEVTRFSSPNILKALIDKNKIEQVLVNLILNAVQAMSKGGKLTIKVDSRKVTIDDLAFNQMDDENLVLGETVVIVDIEDSGTGIPPEILNKIFDPFFTTKSGKGGTGLGLPIVKNIVNLHKGKLTIQNIEGAGVRSRIYLKTV